MSRRRRGIERLLDRIEDRLVDAPPGLHWAGDPAPPDAVSALALDPDDASFFRRWNGLRIANEDVVIHAVEAVEAATAAAAAEEGRLRSGDRVVGEQGRDLLVLPADPWEEGAGLSLVEETGERWPEATNLARFVLGSLAVAAVLYDEEGEFREGVVDEDGTLAASVERKLLRRRLDFDPHAPAPRYRLARSLQRAGELRAAAAELGRVVELAPMFAWGHLARGEVLEAQGHVREALGCYEAASERFDDPDVSAHALACAAFAASLAGDEARRADLAGRVLRVRPEFAAQTEAAAQHELARGHRSAARRMVQLGRAVSPRQISLLDLERRLRE